MSTLEWVLIGIGTAFLVVVLLIWLAWRYLSGNARRVMERIGRLSFRAKLRLAGSLFTDERMPPILRVLVAALTLYLALPIDLIPDFIPVLGQVDDIVVGVVAVSLLTRFLPSGLIEDMVRLQEIEDAAISVESERNRT